MFIFSFFVEHFYCLLSIIRVYLELWLLSLALCCTKSNRFAVFFPRTAEGAQGGGRAGGRRRRFLVWWSGCTKSALECERLIESGCGGHNTRHPHPLSVCAPSQQPASHESPGPLSRLACCRYCAYGTRFVFLLVLASLFVSRVY